MRQYEYVSLIIPYQELSGNYNYCCAMLSISAIIPYQELSGNYNNVDDKGFHELIRPYQELSEQWLNCRTRKPRPAVETLRMLFAYCKYCLIASVALAGSSETTRVKSRSFALPNLSHQRAKSSTSGMPAPSTCL